MRMLLSCIALAAVAGLALVCSPEPAQAQKQYLETFVERYPQFEEQAEELKCNICHGRSKKMRSEYAMALEEALGEKKVKDTEKIMEALAQVEEVEYEDGMTYGELLESEELPPPYEADEDE